MRRTGEHVHVAPTSRRRLPCFSSILNHKGETVHDISLLNRRSLDGGRRGARGQPRHAGVARAQSKTLVAATFPGTWNEADRKVVSPAFKAATGAAVTQSIVLGTDQVARLTAAKGNKPPFDVAFFDTPQVLDAAKEGLIVEYPAAKSPNFSDLMPKFQDKWGPKITMQVIGIGYNPKKITTPPKSWEDLWDPKYKGRVGLTALNSQLGIAFLAELNRIKGGTETDFEPAFKALRELLPNVGAIGANLGALPRCGSRSRSTSRPTTSISCRR